MKVEKEERFNLAFVLTDKEIEKIAKRFDDSNSFVLKATCVDKIVREFKSIDDLVSFENSPNKEIESLGFNVFSKNHERKAFIHFSKSPADNILIQLSGEEKEVVDLFEFLRERFYAMETWYAFIARVKYSGLFISSVLIWVLTVPLVTAFSKLYIKSNGLSTLSWVIIITAILSTNLIISYLWGKIRNLYFPMGAFAIGQGMKRHKDKEVIRTVVILGSLISLITGIFILMYE